MARASFWIALLVGGLCAALALLPRWLSPPVLGESIGAAVLLFNVLLVLAAWLRSHHELLDAWLFVAPLALCLAAPAYLAVRVLGAQTFPALGGERIEGIPVWMPGLWVAPLLVVLWLSEMTHAKSAALGLVVALVSSLVVFAAVEWAAARLQLWLPRGVKTFQGVPLHVLPAEVLLGLATWLMFVAVQGRTIVHKVAGALAVAIFFTGALVVSHLMVQRLA